MDVADCARAYLRGEPSQWLSFAEKFASAIVQVANHELDRPSARQFKEQVLARLLEPDLLYTLVLSRTQMEADELLTESLHEFLVTNPIDLPDSGFDLIDYTHGWVSGELQPRKYWEGWPGAQDWPAALTGFFPSNFEIQPELLSHALRIAKDSDFANQSHQDQGIFRIDVIDVALYRALLEHPELIRTLHWRTFEKLLADILERFGYEIELQRGSKDGGIDLFAVKRSGMLGPERYILQAKRWSNKVGVEPVRQLLFLQKHERATKACLATTARFTDGAWQLAHQYKWQLELRDYDGLFEWIRSAASTRG